MDPVSLMVAFVTAFGVISADAVLHADSVSVSLYMPDDLAKGTARSDVIEDMFIAKLQKISDVNSYFGRPKIQSSRAKTLGGVLARTLKVEDFASAIQHQFGMKTASILGSFSKDEKEKLQLVAMVRDPDEPPYSMIVKRDGYEPMPAMLERAAEQVMEHLAPYITSVYLLQEGDLAHDYSMVDDLISRELVHYASKTYDKERASILNMAGIVALHKNNLVDAATFFEESDKTDPDLVIPRINRAFVMLVTDHEKEVEAYIKPAMEKARYQNAYTLLAAGDLIKAGAHMSAHRFDLAETALDDAEYWDPSSALVQALRADVRAERGDPMGAMKYKAKALANIDKFETYPELASFYYHISWRKGEALRVNDLRADTAKTIMPSTLTKPTAEAGKPAADAAKPH
jgi:tetratricopeptide (TPR) repeat protein